MIIVKSREIDLPRVRNDPFIQDVNDVQNIDKILPRVFRFIFTEQIEHGFCMHDMPFDVAEIFMCLFVKDIHIV